jgi:hypothetical protein
MNATAAPREIAAAPLRIVQLTQHWTIEHGAFYRDCVVELEDGTRRLVGVRDDLVVAA